MGDDDRYSYGTARGDKQRSSTSSSSSLYERRAPNDRSDVCIILEQSSNFVNKNTSRHLPNYDERSFNEPRNSHDSRTPSPSDYSQPLQSRNRIVSFNNAEQTAEPFEVRNTTMSVSHNRNYPSSSITVSFDTKKNENKEPTKHHVWLTPVPAGMESSVMNPSPFTGKKYKKRIKRALEEQLVEAESFLQCKKRNPRDFDSRGDDVDCDRIAIAVDCPTRRKLLAQVRRRQAEQAQGGSCSKPDDNRSEFCRPNREAQRARVIAEANRKEKERLQNIQTQSKIKLIRLNNQLEEAKKKHSYLQRLNNDEDTTHQLAENKILQENIEAEINFLNETLSSIENLHTAHQSLTSGDSSNQTVIPRVGPPPTRIDSPPPAPTTEFQFYDSGDHLCKFCSEMFSTAVLLLEHVHEAHLYLFLSLQPHERPWSVELKPPALENRLVKKLSFKGSEFLYPCKGFFCDLCKVSLSDERTSEIHLQSVSHNSNYQKHCSANPEYVIQRDEDLHASKRKASHKIVNEFDFDEPTLPDQVEDFRTNGATTSRTNNGKSFPVEEDVIVLSDSEVDMDFDFLYKAEDDNSYMNKHQRLEDDLIDSWE